MKKEMKSKGDNEKCCSKATAKGKTRQRYQLAASQTKGQAKNLGKSNLKGF